MSAWEIAPDVLAQKIAQSYSPETPRMDSGYVNVVAIVDERLVVKVPKNNSLEHLQALEHEQHALQFCENFQMSPYAVPRLEKYSSDPPYLVATYVPGRVMTREEIIGLDERSQERIGRELGNFFLRQIANAEQSERSGKVPPTDVLSGSWKTIFNEHLAGFADESYPELTSLAADLYMRWQSNRKDLGANAIQFVHGDPAPYNLTFSDNHIAGAFDYARAHKGEIAEDLSCLAVVNRKLVEACAKELQVGGIDSDIEDATLWRVLKAIYVLSFWIKDGNTKNSHFQASRDEIVGRYPNRDWSELFHQS